MGNDNMKRHFFPQLKKRLLQWTNSNTFSKLRGLRPFHRLDRDGATKAFDAGKLNMTDEAPELRSLSPVYFPDQHKVYVDILKAELTKTGMDMSRNIALTGHYGGSSILTGQVCSGVSVWGWPVTL